MVVFREPESIVRTHAIPKEIGEPLSLFTDANELKKHSDYVTAKRGDVFLADTKNVQVKSMTRLAQVNIFDSSSAKAEMGQEKQDYMLVILSAIRSLYSHVVTPMKKEESYYIGNISMQSHGNLIEAIEEIESCIRSGDDDRIKNYGFIVRTFKVMVCEEDFDQEIDVILSGLSGDISYIYNQFKEAV